MRRIDSICKEQRYIFYEYDGGLICIEDTENNESYTVAEVCSLLNEMLKENIALKRLNEQQAEKLIRINCILEEKMVVDDE